MSKERRAILVVDLAFGDCGKGSVIDFLARRFRAHLVIRFNGGPQAGHNVVTEDGRHHTFSQFGSATFLPGVRTLLSRFMLIEPYALFNEATHLRRCGIRDALGRLMIDDRCLVITPAQQAANRLREIARGDSAHGTCGLGAGEATLDLLEQPRLMIHARDLPDRTAVMSRLRAIRDLKMDQLREVIRSLSRHPKAGPALNALLDCSWIEVAAENYAQLGRLASIVEDPAVRAMLCQSGVTLYEGAQGALLDERGGFHPHTTWSTTTFANAQAVLSEAGYDGRQTRLGVLRTYFTRHGPGPLPTEDAALNAALSEPHNNDDGWQGRFRVGAFDAVAARYALALTGPIDGLAITHLDCLPQLPSRICTAYREAASPDLPLDQEDECFVHINGAITDIRIPPSASLARQERLTRRLAGCQPVFSTWLGSDPEAFLDTMQRELRSKIAITSSGPTAEDKHFSQPNDINFQ